MSQSRKKDTSYPRSLEENFGFQILKYCGGSGGGDCPVLLGATQFVYPIRVPKYLTYNKSLLLDNQEFIGVDIYTDAGAFGLCDHSFGSRVNWHLGFSDNGILTDSQVRDQNILIDITADPPPQTIFVQGAKLPQPVLQGGGANPNWENRIYVHIVWDSAGYLQAVPMYDGILKVVKHDYDIKI